MDKQPMFSVILPVCHGGQFLESALSSLQNVTAPADGFEVIVSGTCEIARAIFDRYAKSNWLFIESRGNRSRALNAACAEAHGEIWVFSDDDCVFPPDWLIKIKRAFARDPEVVAIGGSDVLIRDASDFDCALDTVLTSWFATGGTRSDRSFKTGAYYPKLWNMCVRAKVARHVALDGPGNRMIFNPDLSVHEDVDLIERIRRVRKGCIEYSPDIIVEHSRDTTYAEFFKRNAAMARMCRKQGIHRGPHLALAVAFVSIMALGFLSMGHPALRWILAAALFGYATLLFSVAVSGVFRKKPAGTIPWIPVLLASLHAARAIGFIWPADIIRERK